MEASELAGQAKLSPSEVSRRLTRRTISVHLCIRSGRPNFFLGAPIFFGNRPFFVQTKLGGRETPQDAFPHALTFATSSKGDSGDSNAYDAQLKAV